MRIQHNIMAMSAYRNYTNNVAAMKKNLEKLSSGYKINRAGDDAAGLAISEKMRAQITGLETAQKNAKDGISLVQTAEGALTEVHDMLNRMVELATQSANGTYDNTTDRAQMQKEVDQLLSEIDRIADSSNFNGIKLLDGSLGLNTDAFNIEAAAAFKAQVGVKTNNFELATAGDLAFHYGSSVTAQAPGFQIDFDNLKFTAGPTDVASGDILMTVKFAGATINVKAIASISANSTVDGTYLAEALMTAFNTGSVGTDASMCGVIGGAGFTASNSGKTVIFTYQGKASSGKVAASAIDTDAIRMTDSLASAINAVLGGKVEVTAGTTGTFNGNKQHICDITAPKNAVVGVGGTRPGAGIDIASIVNDGYKLQIDNKTFVFKTDKNSKVTAGSNETLIDVSMHAASDQAKMAAMMVAGGKTADGNAAGSAITTTDFKVSYGGGTKLHVDVKATAAGYKDTPDKVKAKIEEKLSWSDAGDPATAASTKLTIKDADKIVKGDVITITDGSKTTKYVFDKGANGSGVVYLGTDETKWDASNVAKAIGKVMGTTNVKRTGNDIVISAAVAASNVNGPMILGRGLTLQIGDTADSFNQLNVSVQDMHAADLGIGGLKISDEVSAQKAVDKIKAAINTVSDVRGTLGATQNRLDHTINNLSVMTENIQDAESTIRDVDVAEEMMAYTKNNILIQSAQAMLAQANQVPQGVLQLLG